MLKAIFELFEQAGVAPRRLAHAAIIGIGLAALVVLTTGFDPAGGFSLALGFFVLALAALCLWDFARRRTASPRRDAGGDGG